MNCEQDSERSGNAYDMPSWSSNPEPGILPVEIRLPAGNMIARLGKKAVAFIDSDELGKVLFYIPLPHYHNITMTIVNLYDKSEEFAAIIELQNENPHLRIPLSVSFNLDKGEEHGEIWSRALNLPLMMQDLCDDLYDVDYDVDVLSSHSLLSEHKRPRAMILASQKVSHMHIPGLQYDGWDLVSLQ